MSCAWCGKPIANDSYGFWYHLLAGAYYCYEAVDAFGHVRRVEPEYLQLRIV